MNELLSKIGEIGVVPVIAISDARAAVPLARALAEGGVPCAEVTLRTDEGLRAIELMAREVPEVLVGAGTVLTPAQADAALSAGARFIVSPGFNPRVVDHVLGRGALMLPGCATPSDMEQALERGLTAVKFFPAEAAGGLPYIKAVAAPYGALRFMPTGGIGPGNLAEYLAFDRVLACGGSWMVTRQLIDAGDWGGITRLCREAADIVAAARRR